MNTFRDQYPRLSEPASVSLDSALVAHDHEHLRSGHRCMVHQMYRKDFPEVVKQLDDGDDDGLIIDIAAGTGEFTMEIGKRFEHRETVGVDISRSALDKAEKNNNVNSVRFEEGDVYSLADHYRGRAQLVTANAALHNFDDLEGAMRQIRDTLQDGGVFVFTDLNPEWITSAKQIKERTRLRTEYKRAQNMRQKDDGEEKYAAYLKQRLKAGNNDAKLRAAMTMSTFASYTKEEIEQALKNVGFRDIRINTQNDGQMLAGCATKL